VERKERRKRVRVFLAGLVMRPLLFAAWCFVLWGTLLLLLVAVRMVDLGPRAALGLAFGGGGLYGWGNAAAIVLAIVVWPTAYWLRRLSRRAAGEEPGPP
jgi:hypothetical protein